MNIVRVILPIVLIMSAVAAGVFFVYPKYQVFIGIQQEIRDKDDRIRRGEEVMAKLRETERTITARQDDFAKIDTAIPDNIALPAAYHDLQRMGSESGLVLVKVEFEKGKFAGNASLEKTNVTLTFAGSYDGVKNFLSQVKSSERMFNTQSIQLEAQKTENTQEGTLEVQVDIEAYAVQIL